MNKAAALRALGTGLTVATLAVPGWLELYGQSPTPPQPSTTEARELARSSQVFGRIVAAHEIAGGQILVIDGTQRALLVLDFPAGGIRQLGRDGDGPNEYRSPQVLLPLAGDSVLLGDGRTRRWQMLVGARFVPMPDLLRDFAVNHDPPIAIDRRLRILTLKGIGTVDRRSEPLRFVDRPEHADSLLLLRRSPSGRTDTIARVPGGYLGMTRQVRRTVNGEAMRYAAVLNPLQSHAQAVGFADGTVALVHIDPYRVDWLDATGRWSRSVSTPTRPERVTADVQRRAAAAYRRDAKGNPIFRVTDFPPWPATVPPFLTGALRAGPDGRVYVVRTTLDETGASLVDVFDRRMGYVGTLRLPRGMRLITVGRTGLYATAETVDGEQLLVQLTGLTR